MNNTSQPSTGGGGGMMTIIIVIVLLIAIGVGGYFAYTKLWQPYQCNNKDATSNVATFMWDSDSSTCMANVCMTNYGCDATGKLCPTDDVCAVYSGGTPTYKAFSPVGKCTGGTAKSVTTGITKQMDCENACTGTGTCTGYEYNGSTGCDIMTGTLTGTISDNTGYTCYNQTGGYNELQSSTSFSGRCGNIPIQGLVNRAAKTQNDCQDTCNTAGSACFGYQWTDKTKPDGGAGQCYTFTSDTTVPTNTSADTDDFKCYQKTK